MMESGSERESPDAAQRLAHEAARPPVGLLREFGTFLRTNKKWWLAPIILVLLLVGLLIVMSGSVALPFIYPLL